MRFSLRGVSNLEASVRPGPCFGGQSIRDSCPGRQVLPPEGDQHCRPLPHTGMCPLLHTGAVHRVLTFSEVVCQCMRWQFEA